MAAGTRTQSRSRPRGEARAKPLAVPKVLSVLPLVVILGVQVVLSSRLLHIFSAASGDESLYIYAGHQEIYELFHGGGAPTTRTGSPVPR